MPEGEIVELVPVNDAVADDHDDLDEEERERLHESLRESIQQMRAGDLLDAEEVFTALRARR